MGAACNEARNACRRCPGLTLVENMLITTLPDGRRGGKRNGINLNIEFPQIIQIRQGLNRLQEALLFGTGNNASCQFTEFSDVLFPCEGARTQGVGIGNSEFLSNYLTIGHRDHGPGTEGFFLRVRRVITTCPLRILHRGDLLPQSNGLRAGGTFPAVGVFMMPLPIREGHCEDIHDGMIQCLPGGLRIHLLGIIGTGADHMVGVVAGVQHDGFHLRDSARLLHPGFEMTCQINRRLRLVFRRMFLGVGLQDPAFGFPCLWQRYLIDMVLPGE